MLRNTRKNQVNARLQGYGITTPEAALKLAAETFQLLALKLEGKRFFFGSAASNITSLDLASAAYVAVCLNANTNNVGDFDFLPTLLKTAFPMLVEHSHRVLDCAKLPTYTITPDYSVFARGHKKNLLECMKKDLPLPSVEDSVTAIVPQQDSILDDIDDIASPSSSVLESEIDMESSSCKSKLDDEEETVPVKFSYSESAAISVMRAYREHIESNSLLGRMDRDEAEGKNPLWNIFTPLAIVSMVSFFAFAKLRK